MRCSFLAGFGCWLLGVASVFATQPDAKENRFSSIRDTSIGGKTTQQWIRAIQSHDPSEREDAIRMVAQMDGPQAKRAAPAIIDAINVHSPHRDPDAACRVHAAITLNNLIAVVKPFDAPRLNKQEIPRAVEALASAVAEDSQTIVRYYAALALAQFGQDARLAINKILRQVREGPSWEVRRAVISVLAGCARDPKSGADPKVIQTLLVALSSDSSSQVRLEAILALGSLGRPQSLAQVSQVLQTLKKYINDHEKSKKSDKTLVIWAHVVVMAWEATIDDSGLKFLMKSLRSSKELSERMHAARALAVLGREAKLGDKARKKIPELIEMLGDHDPFVVGAALTALGDLGDYANQAADQIVRIIELKNTDEITKYKQSAALEALYKIDDRRAKQIALKMAKESLTKEKEADKEPISEAYLNPKEVGGKTFQEWVRQYRAHSHDPSHVENTIRTVILFDTKLSRETAPFLINALRHNDSSCRVNAALALAKLNTKLKPDDVPKAVEALTLRLTLNESQSLVRFHAVVALAHFGADAQAAIPALISHIHDRSSWQLRRAVVTALASAGRAGNGFPAEPRAIQGILQAISPQVEPSAKVRLEAMIGLATMGKAKDPALNDKVVQALTRASLGGERGDPCIDNVIWAHAALILFEGAVSDTSLSSLVQYLQAKDLTTRLEAARVLATLAGKPPFRKKLLSTVDTFIAMLEDKTTSVQAAAIVALGEFGSSVRAKVVPILLPLATPTAADEKIEDETEKADRETIRTTALAALYKIDEASAKALEAKYKNLLQQRLDKEAKSASEASKQNRNKIDE